jgi:hypothetical protein
MSEMNIQDLGAIGELVAAVATIATLLYLAQQIRQNSKNLQEASSAAMNQGWSSINSRISSDPQFASIFLRGRLNLEELGPVETEQFRAFVQDILNMAVYADGLDGPRSFDAFQVVGSLYQSYSGVRDVIDSLEESTPGNLVPRLREATANYFMIEKGARDDSR